MCSIKSLQRLEVINKITSSQLFHSHETFLAFGFGSGLSPIAPGTVGSLAAVPLLWLMSFLPQWAFVIVVLVCTIYGIRVCSVAARSANTHDHPGIVWDEIVGMMITIAFVPFTWINIILAFFLFRVFDIWKPWPIRFFDRNVDGGLGIMLDDVVAGIVANLFLQIILLNSTL